MAMSEQWKVELDAKNYHANEDRKARNKQAAFDRISQAIVALISALGAIFAAYSAAKVGIDKLSGSSAHYAISTLKVTNGSDIALKLDSKTGETWMFVTTSTGSSWRPLPK